MLIFIYIHFPPSLGEEISMDVRPVIDVRLVRNVVLRLFVHPTVTR